MKNRLDYWDAFAFCGVMLVGSGLWLWLGLAAYLIFLGICFCFVGLMGASRWGS